VLTNEIIYILVYSLIFVIFTNLYDTESTPYCSRDLGTFGNHEQFRAVTVP